jgi:phosphate:Na+ symporter
VAVQSSTTTIGIGIALCSQHVIHLEAALAIVIGANIGIGVTSLIAGFHQTDTRRMAVGILFVKLVGAAVIAPFLPEVIRLLDPLSLAGRNTRHAVDRQRPHGVQHRVGARLPAIGSFLVAPAGEVRPRSCVHEDKGGARYLDPSALASAPLALGQATREILHMADIVRGMLRNAYRCFKEGSETLCEEVQKEDDNVDLLNNEIKAYITHCPNRR